jgi:hypothetical protein
VSEDRIRQEVRKVLRSEEEGLSPGFYARTVARFEAERRRPPFGLAWTTVGLAAATIAVALIFIPIALREELPAPAPARVEQERSGHGEAAPENRPDGFGELEGAQREAVKQDKNVPVTTESEEKLEETVPSGRRERRQEVGAPDDVIGGFGGDERVELDAPAEPDPTAPAAEAELGRDVERGALRSAANEETYFDNDTLVSGDRRAVAFELPEGTVPIGEVEVLDPMQTQDRLAAPRKKSEYSALKNLKAGLSKPAPASRFVAIGRRPGLDACSALELRRTTRAWEIDYEDSGSRTGRVACGIEVPDDGLEILFQGWLIDE